MTGASVYTLSARLLQLAVCTDRNSWHANKTAAKGTEYYGSFSVRSTMSGHVIPNLYSASMHCLPTQCKIVFNSAICCESWNYLWRRSAYQKRSRSFSRLPSVLIVSTCPDRSTSINPTVNFSFYRTSRSGGYRRII